MKKLNLLLAAGLPLAWALINPATAAEPKKVASFDIPPPNNLGGGYGAFSPKAEETVFITVETIDDAVKNGPEGSSMRLEYNVGKPGAFNGFWMKLGPEEVANNFDASGFQKLSFWVKGDSTVGIPAKVKVELKGDAGPIGRYYMSGIRDDWKKIEIPLIDIKGQNVDISKLNEFVIVFENAQAAPGTKGTIWIDDILFE